MSKFRIVLPFLVVSCVETENPDGSSPVLPDVGAATFILGVDNPYHPLPVGMTWAYEAMTDEGLERIEVEVLAETRKIQGVTATIVRDLVTLDGIIVEDTLDWYAQDSEGNVWYLGEDTCEYENNECVNTAGSWEWGVNDALPGVIMPAHPMVEEPPYYQEYFVGQAEDVGEVVEVGIAVNVPAGSYSDCIKTHDTSTLDLTLDEHKTYCPGVGVVLVDEPDLDEELVEHSAP